MQPCAHNRVFYFKNRVFAALLIAFAGFLTSCGGGSGSMNSSKTVLTASATDVPSGTAIQFTANVTPTDVTGNVNFNEGTTLLGTNKIGTGRTNITISTFAAGTHTITAAYEGDSLHSASTSEPVTVTVGASGAPVMTTQPASLTVASGGSATFTVVASGNNLTYQWLKNGTAVPGAITATYTIASVVTGDAGSYTVRVTNTSGSITSTAAVLTVN